MKVRELVDSLSKFNPEHDVFLTDGFEDFTPGFFNSKELNTSVWLDLVPLDEYEEEDDPICSTFSEY